MAVRKVSGRGGNIIGRFPSLKLDRMVDFESLIERDFIYLLDFEPEVSWFAEQPLTIEYQHEGERRAYTPDFRVIRNEQNVLVECKPEQRVNEPNNQRKFAAGKTYCATKGWLFQVVTDEQLRCGYRLRNVQLLTQFARYDIAPQFKQRIRDFLATTPAPVTIAEVMVNIAPQAPQRVKIPILHMAFHHDLILPLDEAPLSTHLPVRLGSGKEQLDERTTF
jgi:hypothetical protein